MDVLRVDMQMVDVTEQDAGDKVRWRQMIYCGKPLKGVAERRRRRKEGIFFIDFYKN